MLIFWAKPSARRLDQPIELALTASTGAGLPGAASRRPPDRRWDVWWRLGQAFRGAGASGMRRRVGSQHPATAPSSDNAAATLIAAANPLPKVTADSTPPVPRENADQSRDAEHAAEKARPC